MKERVQIICSIFLMACLSMNVCFSGDVLNRIEHVHYGQVGSATEAHLASYNYNAVGSMSQVGYLNGVNHLYEFDSLNRLTNLKIDKIGATAAQDINQHHYQYTLNDSGHRTKIEELHSGRVIDHTFDNLYRLTSESIAGGSVNGYIGYTYDEVSNRTRRDSSVAGVTNQTHTYSLNDLLDHHTYDDNGSTIASPDLVNKVGKTSDDYDFRNKLLRRTSDSGDEIYMAYNADGHRVQKVIVTGGILGIAKESNYLVDSNNPTGYSQVVEEKNSTGALDRSYHIGHQRFAMTDHFNGGEISYYSFDGHGSIRGISDEDGDLKEEYDFDSYGILIGFRKDLGDGLVTQLVDDYASLSRNEFLFAGEQWDADMGMYYNRARYYDVENGRFNAMDTWEGASGNNITLNKYLYGNGNPVSGIDPSGNFTMADVQFAVASIGILASRGGAPILRVLRTASNNVARTFQQIYIRGYNFSTQLFNNPTTHDIALGLAEGPTGLSATKIPKLALGLNSANYIGTSAVKFRDGLLRRFARILDAADYGDIINFRNLDEVAGTRLGDRIRSFMQEADSKAFNLSGMMNKVNPTELKRILSLAEDGISDGNITNWEFAQIIKDFSSKTEFFHEGVNVTQIVRNWIQ